VTTHRRTIPLLAAAGALVATTVAAQAAPTAPRSSHHDSGLVLSTPNKHVDLIVHDFEGEGWTEFNSGIYLRSPRRQVEVDVRRTSANKPISAVVRAGSAHWRIPRSVLRGWAGFKDAFVFTWRTPAGKVVGHSRMDWCPNDGSESRLGPRAAVTSVFTFGCGTNPFTRGQRWGIDRGWARQIASYNIPTPANLADGTVMLDVALRPAVARALGVAPKHREVKLTVRVKHVNDGPVEGPAPVGRTTSGPTSASSSSRADAPAEPADLTARAIAASRGVLPDLIALPAWGISTHHEGKLDLLDFAATVYNGGHGPLAVDGFREGSKQVMKAYQLFYRGDKQVGTARVGSMEYDARPSHQHWHFEDFAVYDLVNKAHKRLRTSGKEAFCLAPTDSIDMLVHGAPADPGNGDLSTACGDVTSIWVREVLASGWGDTYTQQRAGQSINITGLPNGAYWIRVTANPGHKLHEASTHNNVAYRKVILGGTKGHRTVKVPAYGLINSEHGTQSGEPVPPIVD